MDPGQTADVDTRPLVKSAYQKNNFLIPQPKHILCTINLAIVLYGGAHPHHISSFICCHEDTSADDLTRFSIKKIQNYQTKRPC